MNHFSGTSLTPPPAHLRGLGHTPPAPHIQVHHSSAGSMHTPPPAHMNLSDHRSSPGLQLLGHVAASPQLRIHGTPSPHLSVSAHSAGSPAHPGLLTIDRPTSRESFSMTPPRAQVFPHSGVQPELLKVLRPHPPYTSPNSLTIPTNVASPAASQADAGIQLALMQQQQQQIQQQQQLQQMQIFQAMQDQVAGQAALQAEAAERHHLLNSLDTRQHQPSHTLSEREHGSMHTSQPSTHRAEANLQLHNQLSGQPPNHQQLMVTSQHQTAGNVPYIHNYSSAIEPPEPSPHHQLKLLANIASSELGILNNEQESLSRSKSEPNNNKHDVSPKVFNQRIQNLNNFPTSSPYTSSYRSHSIAMQRARAVCITGAAKSLDVLRELMQSNINDEIQSIVDRYINSYFRPALENIRDNKGETSVGEEHIQCLCQKMLSEAGKKYLGSRSRSRSATPVLFGDVSEVGSTTSERPSSKLPFAKLKRGGQSDTESEASSCKRGRKRGRPAGSLGPSSLARATPVKREGPRWDPDRLNNDSLFIMGSKANKALGLGNARGRIYLKHPELFKYNGDADDKMWLYENHRMPVTGGKAYLMILEDVQYLASSVEYKRVLQPSHLSGFTIPPWMIAKVQKQMVSLRTDSSTASTKPKMKMLSNVIQQEQYDADSDKNVPFKSAASSRKSLSDSKLGVNSPANTEEMELLSSEEQEDAPVSPFGSAEDYAPVSPNTAAASSLKPPSSPGGIGLAHDRFGIA